jgi:hypothetical protein
VNWLGIVLTPKVLMDAESSVIAAPHGSGSKVEGATTDLFASFENLYSPVVVVNGQV